MSIPGLIARPLLPDEFSLFFESRDPIPLGRMATFFRKIETEAWPLVEDEGLFLELSEYASGSGEPRFRIVGPKRTSIREAEELRRREVEAAERQADLTEKWGRMNFIGSMIVGPVAGAIAASIISGPLNPSAKTIVYEGDVSTVYISTPQRTTAIPAEEIERGRNQTKLVDKRKAMAVAELERLTHSLREGSRVRLAGRVELHHDRPWFRTLSGNGLPLIDNQIARRLLEDRQPAVVEGVVVAFGRKMALEPLDIITNLDDF